MTSGISPGDRHERLAMWAGHHEVTGFLVLVVFFIVGDALGNPQGGPVYWITLPVLAAWGYAFWSATIGPHEKQLCERCSAAVPLDPQAKAARWDRMLWLVHQRRALVSVLVVIGVKALALDHAFRPGAWSFIMDALILTAVSVFAVAQRVHRRLQPWCPYCRWEGGGKEEAVPEVPDPAASR